MNERVKQITMDFRTRLAGAMIFTVIIALLFIAMLIGAMGGASLIVDIKARLGGMFGAATLVMALSTLVVSYFIARGFEHWLLGPLERMNAAMQSFQKSRNFDARVQWPTNDSIGQLANSFNTLITDLQRSEEINRRAMEALDMSRQKAEEASLSKSRFLANMSHELRTPLNAIIGYTEILSEDLEDEGHQAAVDDLEKIHRSARHLLELINDVLDVTKLETDRNEKDIRSFSLKREIASIIDMVRPLALQNGNQIQVRIDDDIDEIQSDSVKLRQCLINLLSNACKFTKDGIITLNACSGTGSTLRLVVSDTGIGMTPEQLERVFAPFAQADATTTRKYGGTGLGLAITKGFVELLSGTISVTSTAGIGSSFTIELPGALTRLQSPASHSDAPAHAASGAERQRLMLVIDDEAQGRDLFKRWMPRLGFAVETAADGHSGLEKACQLKPDVILLDASMPGLSGWDVMALLRASPVTASIPTIMVSAHDQRRRGLMLGANEYLMKPVARESLANIVSLYSSQGSGRILLVEDDDITAELHARVIRQAGFEVVHARSGLQALQIFDENRDFCLAVIDLMMPEMDGFDLIAALETRDPQNLLPIMVVTARELSSEDWHRLGGRIKAMRQKGGLSPHELIRDVFRFVNGPQENRKEVARA
jgi:signal transduction histidine kinase/DNA-binding response OmpR family regulator